MNQFNSWSIVTFLYSTLAAIVTLSNQRTVQGQLFRLDGTELTILGTNTLNSNKIIVSSQSLNRSRILLSQDLDISNNRLNTSDLSEKANVHSSNFIILQHLADDNNLSNATLIKSSMNSTHLGRIKKSRQLLNSVINGLFNATHKSDGLFLNAAVNTSMADLVEEAERARQKKLREQWLLQSLYIAWRDSNDHEVVLMNKGKTLSEFSCLASTLSSPLAFIGPNLASTNIEIHVTHPDSIENNPMTNWENSFNSLIWENDGSDDEFQIDLKSIQFEVIPLSLPQTRRQLQYDSVAIEKGGKRELIVINSSMVNISMQIIPSHMRSAEKDFRVIRVSYLCQREGDARIKMFMKLREYETEPICISFIRRCDSMWNGLRVDEIESGSIVFNNGQLSPDWDSAQLTSDSFRMTDPPSFRLSMKTGNLHIKDIILKSSQPELLQPVLHGNIGNEVSPRHNVQLNLGYRCPNARSSGSSPEQPIQITMSLINEQPLVHPLNFTWFGICSQGSLPSLSIVTSPCQKPLPFGSYSTTFVRDPILVWEDGNLTKAFTKKSTNLFSALPEEVCTSFTFHVAQNDSGFELDDNSPAFPPLSSRPTIAFDAEMVYVPEHTPDVKRSGASIEMRIAYICLHDGMSPFHLTVTFKGVPSYEIYWKKMCLAPVVRDGSGMSATTFPIWGITILGVLTAGICCTQRGRALLSKLKPEVRATREECESLRK